MGYNRYAYALKNPLIFTDPTGEKWKWKYLSPFYWFDQGMQWINDNTSGLRQTMVNANIPAFGAGYNTAHGGFHYVGNSGNMYHNQLRANKPEAIMSNVTITLTNSYTDGRSVNFVNNMGVSRGNVKYASNEGDNNDLSTNFMASMGFSGTVATSTKAFNVINNEVVRQQVFNNSLKTANGHNPLDVVPFKVPTALKIAGKYGGWVFTIYGAYDINNQWTNNQISTGTMAVEQVSNGIGAIPVVGTGWSIGWNLGKVIGPSTWYGNNDYKWFE